MTKPFKWPATWPHVQPKVKKHYRHEVTVASSENADYAYTLHFTSEDKAKAFKKAVLASSNSPLVEYERKELPTFNEERIET